MENEQPGGRPMSDAAMITQERLDELRALASTLYLGEGDQLVEELLGGIAPRRVQALERAASVLRSVDAMLNGQISTRKAEALSERIVEAISGLDETA